MAAALKPRYRIYIVEDSFVLRRLLLEFLGCMEGAMVVGHAASAQAAILDIRQCNPDAVIVDLLLQSGTGFDVLEAVMRERASAPLAIVLTNFTMAAYRERAASLGVAHFFDKGTEIVKMLRVINGLVLDHQRAAGLQWNQG